MGDRFYNDLEFDLSPSNIRNTVDSVRVFFRFYRCLADFKFLWWVDEYYDEDEESEGDYDEEEANHFGHGAKAEDLGCPFCNEDFDVLGLCCHIDVNHRMDVKLRICLVCAAKVGVNMASHVITQYEDVLKALCLKNLHGTRSRSAIFLLRRDLQEKYLRIIKDSQPMDLSRGKAVDSMLVSFLNSPQPKRTAQEAIKGSSVTETSISKAHTKKSPRRGKRHLSQT